MKARFRINSPDMRMRRSLGYAQLFCNALLRKARHIQRQDFDLALRKHELTTDFLGAMAHGVIASLCVAAYTGALLGVCQTYPLWNNALLPILFLISAMSAGAASIASPISGEWAILFWVGLVGVGLILPTALETWLLFFSAKEFEESRKAHWISFVSDMGILAGGFILRYLIVMAAVPLTVAVPLL